MFATGANLNLLHICHMPNMSKSNFFFDLLLVLLVQLSHAEEHVDGSKYLEMAFLTLEASKKK